MAAARPSSCEYENRSDDGNQNQDSYAHGQNLQDLANALLGKTQEIECKDFTVEDVPNNPMHFGRWKESFILSAAKNVRREADLAVKWLAEIKGAQDAHALGGPSAPFSSFDAILHAVFHKKLSGLQLIQYKQLQSQYLGEGRVVRGRQAVWIYLQKFLVDEASRNLHQGKQLRSLTLGSSLHFPNTWSDQVASMSIVPSEMELYSLFVDQVRRYKPMAEVWSLLDQQILPNVSYPPTYKDHLDLCWKFVDKEVKNKARNQITGRVNERTAAPVQTHPQAKVSSVPATSQAAAAPASAAGSDDSNFAKSKGYCVSYITKGT